MAVSRLSAGGSGGRVRAGRESGGQRRRGCPSTTAAANPDAPVKPELRYKVAATTRRTSSTLSPLQQPGGPDEKLKKDTRG